MATDLEVPRLTERQAKALVSQIKSGVEGVKENLVKLYGGSGWKVLGYSSWHQCCREEFGQLGKSASWISRQALAVKDRCQLAIPGDVPESTIRELRRAPEENRADIWNLACDRAGTDAEGNPKTPTAEQVRKLVEMEQPDDTAPDAEISTESGYGDADESEHQNGSEDAGETKGGDEASVFDMLLDHCSAFHESNCPSMSLVAFAAVLESVADQIRSLA